MSYDFKNIEKNGKTNGKKRAHSMLKMIIQRKNGMG